MPSLNLYFLGPPRAEKDGAPIKADTKKAIALLCYLSVTGESHSREFLASLLWSEYDQSHARASLRRTLSALKEALGDGWLQIERKAIGLVRGEGIWLDVAEFHRRMMERLAHGHPPSEVCPDCVGPLTEAARLYRGDFLAGFKLRVSGSSRTGCPYFDDWQSFQTQRLRSEMISGLERLVSWHGEKGEIDLAMSYSRKHLELDRTNEGVHRALMKLYAISGQKSLALKQYRECIRILKRESGGAPQDATTELYEAIKGNRFPKAGPTPPGPSEGTSNNLPRQLTSFIGREREIPEVKRLLSTTYLLTLTGSGGCGKTRLALRVASDLSESFADGVWLVELGALSEASLVPQAVAGVLGVREEPSRNVAEMISDRIGTKNMLLVLDNCEHLIEASVALIERLIHTCQNLRMLATSREALGVAGEAIWRVPSLSLPDPKSIESLDASDLMRYEATRLFVERAFPAFGIADGVAPTIARICYRLDGIPLAIELAAAQARALTVDQIAEQLDDCFSLLMGESQGALPRHRTLRAAIDWSYNLLSEAERSLFRRLSVFAGGWALSAAEEVCRDGLRTEEIVILLTRLVNKSLVVVEKHDGESRYRLLETIRQYATDKLLGSGEAPSLRQRHLNWFLDLAERAEPELKRPDQRAWLDGLEVEHENLRAALGWSLENSETDAGANGRSSLLRLAGAMWRFWYVRSYLTEGRGWLEKALAEAEGEVSPARAKALIGAGFLTWRQDDYGRATAFFEESLSSFRELGDKWGMAESLRGLGFVARDQGDYKRATAFFEESLALFREVGDRGGIAWPLNDLGVVSMNQGHYTRATELCQESLSLFRELGDRWGAAVSLNVLGLVAVRQGDYNRAKVLCGDSLSIFRELGDKRGIAWCLTGLAGASEAQGELGQARVWHEEGLAIYRELGHKRGIAWALGTVGAIARRQGDHERARAFLDESCLLYQALGDKGGIAWCLEGLAIIARARGEAELSALMFGKAEALREEAGVPLPAPYQAEYDLNLASLLAKLGEEELRAVWEEGRGMTVEQVIDAYKQNISSSPSP